MVWDRKTFTLKQQGKTWPLGPRHDVHITPSMGPNSYNVKYGNTGQLSQKFSIGHRPPTSLATVGKDAPGPTYIAPDERSKSFTIGVPVPLSSDTDGPGPAVYEPPESIRGPQSTLASKLDNELCSSTNITLPRFFGWNVGYTPFRKANVEDSPGPAYDIGTTVGKGVSKSVAWRQKFHISREGKVPAWPASNRRAPAPGSYNPRFSDKPTVVKQSMGPRNITPTDLGEPGPSNYKTDSDPAPKKAYSFGSKGKPAFPIILNYVEHSISKDIPAPHQFQAPTPFSKNSAPKVSIAARLKDPVCKVPAPNTYRPEKAKGHTPEFSLASKPPRKDDNGYPGPGAYNLAKKPNTPMFKMTGRPRARRTENTPGPNAYNLAETKSKKKAGASFKGRPSPFVYSGFRNTARLSTLCS